MYTAKRVHRGRGHRCLPSLFQLLILLLIVATKPSVLSAQSCSYPLRKSFKWNVGMCDDKQKCSKVRVVEVFDLASRGYPYHFTNECTHPIKLVIRYNDVTSGWRTTGWWNFDAGEGAYLSSSNKRLLSNNVVWYYYAKVTDASGLHWPGKHSYSFRGETVKMKRMEDHNGENRWKITCTYRGVYFVSRSARVSEAPSRFTLATHPSEFL